MPRYVDADDLKSEVEDVAFIWCIGRGNGKSLIKQAINHFKNAVIAKIDNASTIDAVEVVRCHDCKNFDEDNHYCKVWNQVVYEWFDFCGRAERREQMNE